MTKKLVHFIADQRFIDYIKMMGYSHQFVAGTHKLYFTNKSVGCQIVVNLKAKNITFLNKQGFQVDKVVSVDSTTLKEYSNNPNINLWTNDDILKGRR